MHHTDYRHNLLQAKHRAAKISARNATSGHFTQNRRTNPLHTVIAAVLVLIAILQMDPANAEPTMDIAGYGSLQLLNSDKVKRATVVSNNVNLLIKYEYVTMMLDQTFVNQTRQIQLGEYAIALPENAQLNKWTVLLNKCDTTMRNGEVDCISQANSLPVQADAKLTRKRNVLLIQTPGISPKQSLRVQLEIKYSKLANSTLLSTLSSIANDRFSTEQIDSVNAASALLTINTRHSHTAIAN